MQTHDDRDFAGDEERRMREAFGDLVAEAERMTADKLNTITAGDEGEEVVREMRINNVLVRELPQRETDGKLNLSRISIGSIPGGLAYVVFRGPIKEVKLAMKRARNALRGAS